MSHIVKLLVVANPNIESEEVRDAIVQRATAGPVHVTLMEPAAVGAGPLAAPGAASAAVVERMRHASIARLQRAVARLRDAGVAVEGLATVGLSAQDAGSAWDPSRFDEVVVSCVPWVSLRTSLYEPGSTVPRPVSGLACSSGARSHSAIPCEIAFRASRSPARDDPPQSAHLA